MYRRNGTSFRSSSIKSNDHEENHRATQEHARVWQLERSVRLCRRRQCQHRRRCSWCSHYEGALGIVTAFQLSFSAQFMQAGQVDLSVDSEYSPVEMNERGSSCLPLTCLPHFGAHTVSGEAVSSSNGESEVKRAAESRGEMLRRELRDMKQEWGLGVSGVRTTYSYCMSTATLIMHITAAAQVLTGIQQSRRANQNSFRFFC
jgi:hypothetical protein